MASKPVRVGRDFFFGNAYSNREASLANFCEINIVGKNLMEFFVLVIVRE